MRTSSPDSEPRRAATIGLPDHGVGGRFGRSRDPARGNSCVPVVRRPTVPQSIDPFPETPVTLNADMAIRRFRLSVDTAAIADLMSRLARARTLAEFMAYAKSKPGQQPYGTSGTGGTPHLAGELMKQRTGINMEHIPYKGGGQAMTDVLGGQMPLVFTAIASAQQHVKSRKVVALGVPSRRRSAALPDVPTFIKSGIPNFGATSWVGIFAPAKTPRPVIDKLQREIAAVLQADKVKERYAVRGIQPVGNTPEQFTEQIRADLARWGEVVKAANIKVE
jgi:tripartite-type tricarboxylate transporter receptor subunit TctC